MEQCCHAGNARKYLKSNACASDGNDENDENGENVGRAIEDSSFAKVELGLAQSVELGRA